MAAKQPVQPLSLGSLIVLTSIDIAMAGTLYYAMASGSGNGDAAAAGDALTMYGLIFLVPITTLVSLSVALELFRVKEYSRIGVYLLVAAVNAVCLIPSIMAFRL